MAEIGTDLTGKTAIITGAAGGIGSECARRFARNGAFAVLADVNAELGEKAAEEIRKSGGRAVFISCDVTDGESCGVLVEKAAAINGSIDILMNNAGLNIALEKRGKIYQYEPDSWQLTIDVCMDGMYNIGRQALPYLKKKGGRIINTGSVTGFRAGLRNQCAYNMAKAAIHNLTRTCAIEYGPFGITVNSVIPGTTWHPNFFKGLDIGDDMKKKFLSHVPLGEPNIPADMAAAALFLASDDAVRITGLLMNVDGGWAAGFCKE